ncbi:MAG: heparinase II/III family protein [Mobilicoccus sp.]|nr:heparinase II/III family protein [Mobilicoccus sp.]
MSRRARLAAVLLTAVMAAGSVIAVPTSAHAATPSTDEQWRAAGCGFASTTPVPDGSLPAVSMPPAAPWNIGAMTRTHWAQPAVADPTWRLWFYSLRWTRPVAKRAYDDGQTRTLAKVLSQIDSFYRLHPDTGKPLMGWDEGTSLRRLETLNCLYILTGDPRLERHMAAEVAVQFSPRYYGPPYAPVHNHGLMANLRVKHAGELTGRRDWVDRSRARIHSESALAFTRQGTSVEQSSDYHLINRTMWLDAANRLEASSPGDPVAKDIRARMEKAAVVGRWLTAPDGDLVQIGDSRRTPGLRPLGTERARAFRDDEAGLIAGRWSWTDPDTSHYTLRYGPARWAHGHHDKGAVTWSTAGTRVLVGPGYFSYDWSDRFAARARTAQAQNASWPVRGRLDVRASAIARYGEGNTANRHVWRVSDRVYGVSRSRTVQVEDPARRLVVTDAYPARTAIRQSWHLDPAWDLVNVRGRTLNLRHADGRTLQITTTGTIVSHRKGSTNPLEGWNYPGPRQRTQNWQITLGGSGTMTTTFTVR